MRSNDNDELAHFRPSVNPRWIDVRTAGLVIPELRGKFGHSGPPLEENSILPLHQNSIADLLCYEGIIDRQQLSKLCALDESDRQQTLEKLIRDNFGSANVSLLSNWDINVVAPLVGMVSESMPVMVVKDEFSDRYVYAPLNEGIGNTLRFGSLGTEVVDRLDWIGKTLAPLLSQTLNNLGGIDLLPIVKEALLMGDELHMRCKSSSLMIAAKLIPAIAQLDAPREQVVSVIEFLQLNPLFFLNLSMCVSRLYLKTQENRSDKTIVTACASNGKEIGIQVSTRPGRWFTAPSPIPRSPDEKQLIEEYCPAIGDSPVIEAFGLGGRVTLLAPGLWKTLGFFAEGEIAIKGAWMSEAAAAQLSDMWLPYTENNDLPILIDVNKVNAGQISMLVNTARLSVQGKFLGAGTFEIPPSCFHDAMK
jgi:hypothetical protein